MHFKQLLTYLRLTGMRLGLLINFGEAILTICSQQIFDDHPANEPFDLGVVFEELSQRGELAGYEVHQRFYEVGSHQGLKELDRLLREEIANS